MTIIALTGRRVNINNGIMTVELSVTSFANKVCVSFIFLGRYSDARTHFIR